MSEPVAPDSPKPKDDKAENVEQKSNVSTQSRQEIRAIAQGQPGSANTNAQPSLLPQRVMSSQQPQTNASIDGVMEGTRDRLTKNGTNSPTWPTPPRLKSPPPNNKPRRDSSEQSNTAKRLAPVSAPDLAAAMLLPESSKEPMRAPTRTQTSSNSNLETVVEGSLPTTPSIDLKADPMTQSTTSTTNSSTNQSDTNKPESDAKRAPSAVRATSSLAKRSFTSLTGGKKKSQEPTRTLTVETEPAAPITNTGLGDRRGDGGSIRTKTSNETIRPKKEKKKPARKHAQLAPGALTSKADIFEAKVASAMDQVDSDDSEETFVYESNPPEPRSYRHHSRTPSATSVTSNNDYRSNKNGYRSGSNAISGKKSMKFSSNYREYDDDPSRPSTRNTSTPRPHHVQRYSRHHQHPSAMTDDSPFANQSRNPHSPRLPTGTYRTSRPNSPRMSNGKVLSPRKYGGSAYDNGEEIADDERAPLMGTVRVRNRHSRRPYSRDFGYLEMGEDKEPGCWSRCGGWLLIIVLLIFICTGIGTFAMILSRPLYDVEIHRIMNVLTSEQELMLDLDVKAVNPNLFAVSVMDLDISIFAKSPYVSTSKKWEEKHPPPIGRPTLSQRRKRGWFWPDPPPHTDDGVDEGTDPDDPEGVQKMLLGEVYEFDSPLTFEPAPVRRTATSSVGQIRLHKPGNKTEVGGSERWERVLLHDFELIARGVLKYQLPLSSKVRSVKVEGRRTVHPDSEDKKIEWRDTSSIE